MLIVLSLNNNPIELCLQYTSEQAELISSSTQLSISIRAIPIPHFTSDQDIWSISDTGFLMNRYHIHSRYFKVEPICNTA